MKKIFLLLFVVLFSAFLAHYLLVGQATYGDGLYYWSYTRSLYFDHDLNFSNELGHHWSPKNNNSIHEEPLDKNVIKTSNKLAWNRYPPGAPFSWIPFFILADSIGHVINFTGGHLAMNGYSDIYQIFVGVENILFVIIGLFILFAFLQKIFVKQIALLSMLTILFATNLFYYGSIDIVNSHPFSFLLSCVFYFLWFTTLGKRSKKEWFVLGIIIGLLALTRTQDITLGSVIIIEITIALYKSLKEKKLIKAIRLYVFTLFYFGIGAVLAFLPQLLIWNALFGSFFHSPYVSTAYSFNFLHPYIWDVIANPQTGFLRYSPLLIFAISGLILFAKRKPSLGLPLLGAFLLQFYIISSWDGRLQGESYGIRMLLSSMLPFAIGISEILYRLQKKILFRYFVIIAVCFTVLNFLTIFYFHLFLHTQSMKTGSETRATLVKQKILQMIKLQ